MAQNIYFSGAGYSSFWERADDRAKERERRLDARMALHRLRLPPPSPHTHTRKRTRAHTHTMALPRLRLPRRGGRAGVLNYIKSII